MKHDIKFYWRQILRRLPLMMAIIIVFTALAWCRPYACRPSSKPRRGFWWNRRRFPTTWWT
jgi:hypothetical protein